MKRILSIISLALFVPAQRVFALNESMQSTIDRQSRAVGDGAFNRDVTVSDIVGTVIEAFLGLLALIFIVLLLIAGYQYFTAQGDSTKSGNALKSIKTALIGLVIILAAYALTVFVFKVVVDFNSY